VYYPRRTDFLKKYASKVTDKTFINACKPLIDVNNNLTHQLEEIFFPQGPKVTGVNVQSVLKRSDNDLEEKANILQALGYLREADEKPFDFIVRSLYKSKVFKVVNLKTPVSLPRVISNEIEVTENDSVTSVLKDVNLERV